MVETRNLEVCTIEMDQIAGYESLGTNNYWMLLKNGKYAGTYSTVYKKEMMSSIRTDTGDEEELFRSARKFFSVPGNKEQMLALLDGEGDFLTYFVWNQRSERENGYLERCLERILTLLEKDFYIVFEDWNEYTADYIRCVDEWNEWRDHIFLRGKHWELSRFFGRYQKAEQQLEKEVVVSKDGIYYKTEEKEVYALSRMKARYLYRSIYFYLDSYYSNYQNIVRFICTFGNMPEGFCTIHKTDEAADFLGKPIDRVENLSGRSEIVIVVRHQKDIDLLSRYVSGEQMVYAYQLYEYDIKFMKNHTFQTWGTDDIWAAFRNKRIEINVDCRNEKNCKKDGLLLWECVKNKSPEQYIEYMKQVNQSVQLYTLQPLYETNLFSSIVMLIRNLQEALDKNRQVILYGVKSHYTNMWMHILDTLNVTFEIMNDGETEDWYGYPVKSIYELPFYDMDQVLVILNQPYEELTRAQNVLKLYGVSVEDHNCISAYEQIDRLDRGSTMIDISAGPLCELLAKQKIPGYWMIGSHKETDYKIMTLGGSTSDSTMFQYASWPELLQQILSAHGVPVTIFAGGVAGATSCQELSKLIRDVREIKPDMIISYSGYNDAVGSQLSNGYVNGICGTNRVCEHHQFEYWLENEKLMKLIADKENTRFYCFAQPMYYLKDKPDKYDLILTRQLQHLYPIDWNWKNEVREITQYSWFINLMDIFDEHSEVFFDICHVTMDGNRIIAGQIYEYIKDAISV